MVIGLLSDTHGYLDEKLFDFFSCCDEYGMQVTLEIRKLSEDLLIINHWLQYLVTLMVMKCVLKPVSIKDYGEKWKYG